MYIKLERHESKLLMVSCSVNAHCVGAMFLKFRGAAAMLSKF
jgi:hypothetical protein